MSVETALANLTEAVDGIVTDFDNMKAGYEGKANALEQLITDMSIFVANMDTTRTEFTDGDGGWFADFETIFDQAPRGSQVIVFLTAGQTFDFGTSVTLYGRTVLFRRRSGTEGANPKIRFRTELTSSGDLNTMAGMFPIGGGVVEIDGVDIELEGKVDASKGWNIYASVMRTGEGTTAALRTRNCVVTGGAGQGLISCGAGSVARIGMRAVTLDGPFSALVGAGGGIGMIARHNVTLLNGATLADGGTLGVDLLQN